jgi:hypothetical protein
MVGMKNHQSVQFFNVYGMRCQIFSFGKVINVENAKKAKNKVFEF